MIYNFGSINVDHVYQVRHLPQPGETLAAENCETFLGGKGINQSIAVAKAGGDIRHIGAVGPDGDWVLSQITEAGVNTEHIKRMDTPTGHAIINVDTAGENAIVIFSGANLCLTPQQIEENLKTAGPEDWVLLQNETNLASEICRNAQEHGCRIAYSAAPFVAEVTLELLPLTDLLVVNELEAEALAKKIGCAPKDIPAPQVLVTRGSKGAWLRTEDGTHEQEAFPVEPVDTTGAGDTFLGSFLALYADGSSPQEALKYASAASAIQVTKSGAANAIPEREEVEEFLQTRMTSTCKRLS